jgi:integrase
MAAEYVAVVDRMTIGQWSQVGVRPAQKGKPLGAKSKHRELSALRTFFRDGQEWEWFKVRFDPQRCFATPRSIRARIAPNPRIIEDDLWAKLLWAGLNLTVEDLPLGRLGQLDRARSVHYYPLELVRAMVIIWLFAGLRADEIYRLRLGCVRWQPTEEPPEGNTIITSDAAPAKRGVCLLEVPVNKTSTAFTKPVDPLIGEAIAEWEKVRPVQKPLLDSKTGEMVNLLFMYRGKYIGRNYLNRRVIKLLCHKAGIPESDRLGNITSHRARSTIASQLFNAREPMSLFELQQWLGHSSPASTQYYAKISPTKLTKAYSEAGYFEHNVRSIKVLIDQEALKQGAAANGEAWKFYDLGHGYCTYDFFDQCPHRMACAKCAFYRPKGSSQAQLLEAKANLLHLRQDIPLTNEERAAVDDGLKALEQLCLQLADTPTPAGPTPREMLLAGKKHLPMVAE